MDAAAMASTYLRMVWRKRWYIVIPLVVCTAGSVFALRHMTPQYRATTSILVQPPNIPQEYVKPTAISTLELGLKTLHQQVTSRSRLERAIRELELFPPTDDPREAEGRIQAVRSRIDIRAQRDEGFSISYVSPDPVEAANMANKLADLFIEMNSRLRQDQARATSEFLADELERIRGQLIDQETAIADFKRRHQNELPEQQDANVRTLESLERTLRDNQLSLERARDRKALLEAQLGDTPAYSLADARTADPDDPRVQLVRARRDLASLKLRYTEKYPEVQRLQKQIAELERQVKALPEDASDAPGILENPSYERLSTEIQSVELEMTHLKEEALRIRDDIDVYRARVEGAPAREQELLSLTRDYNTLQSNYQNLLGKKTDAQIAETLELERQGEQFVILDRARPPAVPFRPVPAQIIGAGLLVGLGLGGGLVGLQELLRPTFYSPQQLQESLGVPVVGAVPLIRPGKRRRQAGGESS